MKSSAEVNWSLKHQHDRFCRQILQLYPEVDFPDAEFLKDVAYQQIIYEALFSETATQYKLAPRYQLRVLKELVMKIENSIEDWDKDEISDQLMKCLSSLIIQQASFNQNPQEKVYITYTLSGLANKFSSETLKQNLCNNYSIPQNSCSELPTITLYESHGLLAADGTTGFRTWEAALHMGNYLCNHPETVRAKYILELGSGTGYITILCALYLHASHVLATDGSSSIISTHDYNFRLNGLQQPHQVRSEQLLWQQSLEDKKKFRELHNGNKIDMVLCADVIYDDAGISALLVTLSDILWLFPDVHILISTTVRNKETFNLFLKCCNEKKWQVTEVYYETKCERIQEGPFFKITAPIKIISIRKCITQVLQKTSGHPVHWKDITNQT